MVFNQAIHTKVYLLTKGKQALYDLAMHSEEFAKSELANDFEILSAVLHNGNTVAHTLAENQSAWLGSPATKNHSVLLLENREGNRVLHYLAEYQSDWVTSEEANNIDLISITNKYGATLAHFLAEYQPSWCGSDLANNRNVLLYRDNYGVTVAHRLALTRPQWLHSEHSKDLEILMTADDEGETVAHILAEMQKEWINTKESKMIEILQLKDMWGMTVASKLLLNNRGWIHTEIANDKRVLCIKDSGNSIASRVIEKYSVEGQTFEVVAMKLIQQGAAFFTCDPINSSQLENLISETKLIIDDCVQPEIKLRYGQALYSTIFHGTKLYEQGLVDIKNHLLGLAEGILVDLYDKHTELHNIEKHCDFHCEPSIDVLIRLTNKYNLSNLDAGFVEKEQAAPAPNLY